MNLKNIAIFAGATVATCLAGYIVGERQVSFLTSVSLPIERSSYIELAESERINAILADSFRQLSLSEIFASNFVHNLVIQSEDLSSPLARQSQGALDELAGRLLGKSKFDKESVEPLTAQMAFNLSTVFASALASGSALAREPSEALIFSIQFQSGSWVFRTRMHSRRTGIAVVRNAAKAFQGFIGAVNERNKAVLGAAADRTISDFQKEMDAAVGTGLPRLVSNRAKYVSTLSELEKLKLEFGAETRGVALPTAGRGNTTGKGVEEAFDNGGVYRDWWVDATVHALVEKVTESYRSKKIGQHEHDTAMVAIANTSSEIAFLNLQTSSIFTPVSAKAQAIERALAASAAADNASGFLLSSVGIDDRFFKASADAGNFEVRSSYGLRFAAICGVAIVALITLVLLMRYAFLDGGEKQPDRA